MKEITQEDMQRIFNQLTPEDQKLLAEIISDLIDDGKYYAERAKQIMTMVGFKP